MKKEIIPCGLYSWPLYSWKEDNDTFLTHAVQSRASSAAHNLTADACAAHISPPLLLS